MTDMTQFLAGLRRPRMLIRAARLDLTDYRRDRDLRRLILRPDDTERILPKLMVEEARLEDRRSTGCASYSLTRHVDVLIALLAEVRLRGG